MLVVFDMAIGIPGFWAVVTALKSKRLAPPPIKMPITTMTSTIGQEGTRGFDPVATTRPALMDMPRKYQIAKTFELMPRLRSKNPSISHAGMAIAKLRKDCISQPLIFYSLWLDKVLYFSSKDLSSAPKS